MSGIVGSKFNIRGSGLVGSLGTDGQHMLSAGAGVSNVFETVAAGGSTPAFSAELGTDQDIGDNSLVKAAFTTEVFDSGSVYDNSSNYRFTPGVEAKYFIYLTAMFQCALAVLGASEIHLYKNGSSIMGVSTYNDSDEKFRTHSMCAIVLLDADDYIEAYVKGDTTYPPGSGGQNIFINADSQFGGFKIA
tara:strand:- start:441 stop:1010 length:570 start_codon:yes stop_codon:yes gene_type:complete